MNGLKNYLRMSDIDVGIINEYNRVIEKATDKQAILAHYTQNTNKATAELILTSNGMAIADDKIQKAIATASKATKATQAIMQGLATAGNLLSTVAISWAITKAVEAFDNYIHRVEKAKAKTEEAISTHQSISSEVEALESKLDALNNQIGKLNPITHADDIKNLKEEGNELERQLAILEEKERVAQEDSDNAAQKSLFTTQASKYQTEELPTYAYDAYGIKVERPSGTTLVATQVTESEELQNAMEAYEEYAQQKKSLDEEFSAMSNSEKHMSTEWYA